VQARFVNDFNGSKTMNMIYGMGARRFQVWWYLDANNDLMAEMNRATPTGSPRMGRHQLPSHARNRF